jgi:antitoxin ParD1/3/4
MNVSLTSKQEAYIANQIETGDYQNASELVRDALRLHQIYRDKVIQELRTEIEKGWEGPTSSKNIQSIISAKQKKA